MSAKAAFVYTHFVFHLYCKSSLEFTFIFQPVSRQYLIRNISKIFPPQRRLGVFDRRPKAARDLYATPPGRRDSARLHFQQNLMSGVTVGRSGRQTSFSFATRICPLEMI